MNVVDVVSAAAPAPTDAPGPAEPVGSESLEGRCSRLEQRAVELAGMLNALNAELVGLIGEVEAHGVGNWHGIRSITHWLGWRCGLSPAQARRLVGIARRRDQLPVAAEAFCAGELSLDQMSVIADRCPTERDAEVTELAKMLALPQLRRLLAHVPRAQPAEPGDPSDAGDPPASTEPVEERRRVSFGLDEGGSTWRAHLELPPDEGATVELSWLRGRDAAFAEAQEGSGISWADGVVRAAEVALEGLDTGLAAGCRPAHRHQVIYHLPAEHPATPSEPGAPSATGAPQGAHVHGAGPIPQWLERYLTCDCTRRWVLEAGGRPVAVSSRHDTVAAPLRTLIEERDRGCRVPGCAQTRWLHIHHITHRHDGGPTEPANLVALCPAHHREHHQGRLGISGDPTSPGGLEFTDRWGRPILEPPRPKAGARPPPIQHNWCPPTGETLDARWFAWNPP